MREIFSLNEGWRFVKDSSLENLAPDCGEPVTLPHTWSTNDDAQRGICWYVRELPRPAVQSGMRVWLQCEGAAMTAEVYLNGEKLIRHEGGYSTFRVDLTEHLHENNLLAVSVDNGADQRVYPQNADFTFYGGLYRDVKLILVPAVHFALGYCGTPGIKVTPEVDLSSGNAIVTVEAWVEGEGTDGQTVTFAVAGRTQTARIADGHVQSVFAIENVHLWDGLEDPFLYTASVVLDSDSGRDKVSARFGCRKFEIDPQKGFLLNGRTYPLRGVSCHQDRAGIGSALTPDDHRANMDIVRELGANTLRLAHYQHAQEFYDLCDENGIVVWAEIPYITRHMRSGRANTLSQMEELIVQNYNHPCIAVWGLSNEISAASMVDEDVLENHRLLNDLCHRLDPARSTTLASVYTLDTASPILDIPDVSSYNLYYGWYLGETKQAGEFFDAYHDRFPERPIGFSEYGADANPQFQSAAPQRGDYSETYQALYHEQIWRLIEERPYLWVSYVWNLFDFGADGRDEGGKHAQNQKGLVTFDRSIKKDAFYFYKAVWNRTDPFVHLCGSRYKDRIEDVTEIKVYSNQSEVALYVDGALADTQTGSTVFVFHVPIFGMHKIEAVSGACRDSMQVQKAATLNKKYSYDKKRDVVNWFDQKPVDPAFYSVGDKIADLRAHPQAAAVVDELMAKVASGQGEDDAGRQDHTDIQRMIGRLTLQNLLKFSGGAVTKDEIKQANRILQAIRKPMD